MKHLVAPLVLILSVSAAIGQTPGQDDILRAELRPGWREADGRHIAALHLQLAPHWKTYWRSPGDTGVPPEFDWGGSQNVGAVTIHWPRPEIFEFQGMKTIGYADELVLPVEITPKDPSRPVWLASDVSLGVCNDICVPAMIALSGDLPASGAPDALIKAALGAVPVSAAAAGLADLACIVEPLADGVRLTARMRLPAATGPEMVVLEPSEPAWVSEAEVTREGEMLIAISDIVPPEAAPFDLRTDALRVTVLSDGQAVEATGCPVN